MTKGQRYRLKCIQEGRCDHCGQPCAPFAKCEVRRRKQADWSRRYRHATGKSKQRYFGSKFAPEREDHIVAFVKRANPYLTQNWNNEVEIFVRQHADLFENPYDQILVRANPLQSEDEGRPRRDGFVVTH